MTCQKIGYATEHLALVAGSRITRRPGQKIERRAYGCPDCREWHLTAAPQWVDRNTYDVRKLERVK